MYWQLLMLYLIVVAHVLTPQDLHKTPTQQDVRLEIIKLATSRQHFKHEGIRGMYRSAAYISNIITITIIVMMIMMMHYQGCIIRLLVADTQFV